MKFNQPNIKFNQLNIEEKRSLGDLKAYAELYTEYRDICSILGYPAIWPNDIENAHKSENTKRKRRTKAQTPRWTEPTFYGKDLDARQAQMRERIERKKR